MSLWGSLQKGVASLESRLDTILGETGDVPQQSKQDAITTVQPTKVSTPVSETQENNVGRKPTTSNSANDRLQARLAKAVAARTQSTSSNLPSRSGTPTNAPDLPRSSIDAVSIASVGSSHERPATPIQPEVSVVSAISPPLGNESGFIAAQMPNLQNADNVDTPNVDITTLPPSKEPIADNLQHASTDAIKANADDEKTTTPVQASSGKGREVVNEHSNHDHEFLTDVQRADVENRQEIHTYMEKIDALQAKLQYLSRAAVESARSASISAPSGSLEKKLAQRDEQIALLLEEGQKLSKTEMKYLTVIKGLRIKIAELEKDVADNRKRAEKLETDNSESAAQLKRIDQMEKQLMQYEGKLRDMSKELATVAKDRDAKAMTITSLNSQLKDAEHQVDSDQARALKAQLEQEKRRTSELENDLSSLKIEKELASGRAKVQLDEFRAKSEREAERARVLELELRAEQQMLEGRLEVLRTRAEEVSTGATGDAQAKLLRQVEQLQSQYAIASENWQRIEASITSQATNLEKERDEARKKETDIRRKAREMNVKFKRIEDEAEENRLKAVELQQAIDGQKHVVEKLTKRASESEAALIEARKTFELEKQAWLNDMSSHLEDSHRGGKDPSRQGSLADRAESPMATMQRGLTAEHLGLQNSQTARRSIGRPATYDAPSANRKASSQLIKNGSGRHTPIRNNSQQSLFPSGDVNYAPPSILGIDHDDDFDNVATPTSPFDKMNDILSVSTIGAGPSVQLVERMSAAVRRLENEKLSKKEEMARLSAQRDEARAEITTLMSEIESKRALEAKLREVETANEITSDRLQTTLEMLGEKSELVEELRQDVQDIKDMYRELVERTVSHA